MRLVRRTAGEGRGGALPALPKGGRRNRRARHTRSWARIPACWPENAGALQSRPRLSRRQPRRRLASAPDSWHGSSNPLSLRRHRSARPCPSKVVPNRVLCRAGQFRRILPRGRDGRRGLGSRAYLGRSLHLRRRSVAWMRGSCRCGPPLPAVQRRRQAARQRRRARTLARVRPHRRRLRPPPRLHREHARIPHTRRACLDRASKAGLRVGAPCVHDRLAPRSDPRTTTGISSRCPRRPPRRTARSRAARWVARVPCVHRSRRS